MARNGTQLVWLSGYVPVPLWLEVLVDPETGAVHEQRMLAAQHFMNSSFSDFRRQSDVVPGPRDSARTDS